jgi:hypothetical protein
MAWALRAPAKIFLCIFHGQYQKKIFLLRSYLLALHMPCEHGAARLADVQGMLLLMLMLMLLRSCRSGPC